MEAAGSSGGAAASGLPARANADPLERIVRTFDAAAFRQAAAMLDEMNAGRLAALTPRERARTLCAQAKSYLDRGLLLEAERLYQAAVAADGNSAEAHAGLAEVRERSGDGDAARKEAHAALELGPSADAYLVLAQLDFAAGALREANRSGECAEAGPGEPGGAGVVAADFGKDGAEVAGAGVAVSE